MSHTPGPWTYKRNPMRDDGWFAYGPEAKPLSFAQISEADARLISAAPEMYEALERIEYWLSDARVCCFPTETLRSALKKARGES